MNRNKRRSWYGFCEFANFLLEAVYSYKFSARELRILLWIIRESYGRCKAKKVCISQTQLSSAIGLNKSDVNKTLKNLVARKVLILFFAGNNSGKPSVYGINKMVERWEYEFTGSQRPEFYFKRRGDVQEVRALRSALKEGGGVSPPGGDLPTVGDSPPGGDSPPDVVVIRHQVVGTEDDNHAVCDDPKERIKKYPPLTPPLVSSLLPAPSKDEERKIRIRAPFIEAIKEVAPIMSDVDRRRLWDYVERHSSSPAALLLAMDGMVYGMGRVKSEDAKNRTAGRDTWRMKVQQSIIYAEEWIQSESQS